MPYYGDADGRCRLWSVSAKSLGCFGFIFFGGILLLNAQSGITNEGPLTVFRTGSNAPLLSLSLTLAAPPTNQNSILRFDFGFATDEPDLPATFFDSFSVTLQNSDRSATALLLTADRTGVQWAPPNPGGLPLSQSDVTNTDAVFPNLDPALAIRFAYSVSFVLPLTFLGGPITLLLDLFDNLNAAASLAYVSGVRIDSDIGQPRLHSAAVVDGIYAEETGAVLDPTNRTFTLSKTSGNRFFRVFADRPNRIVAIRDLGQLVIVGFKFEMVPQLTLQTSTLATGPFAVDSTAVWDSTNNTFTLPKSSTNSFYRIAGNSLTRITGIHAAGGQVIVEYQLIQIRLFSAGSVTGPFAEESGAELNETNRTFTLSQPSTTRFYKIVSDVPMQIVATRPAGGQLVIEYQLAPSRTMLQSAATPNGPFADEAGAVLNEIDRKFTLGKSSGNRFYRIRSDRQTRIGRLHVQGNELLLDYDVVP